MEEVKTVVTEKDEHGDWPSSIKKVLSKNSDCQDSYARTKSAKFQADGMPQVENDRMGLLLCENSDAWKKIFDFPIETAFTNDGLSIETLMEENKPIVSEQIEF